jgi:hypothetical protein
MPGRNEAEAWRDFRDPILRSVGCIDLAARLNERRFDDGVRLLATPHQGIRFGKVLTLSFSFRMELTQMDDGRQQMSTRRYDFTITSLAEPDKPVFGWHWHPASRRSPITYPHVHVPSASQFKTRHIPTGRVALEDVILFGFDDLDVEPAHDQAVSILTEVRNRHKQHRSWS